MRGGGRTLPAVDDRTATVRYRIRFDESGPTGIARPSLYLRLAQDAAWIHSERLGFTRGWYADRRLAWLVRAVALEIRARARHGDEVEVTTSVLGYRRIWARRRADVVRDRETVATVLTDWIMTDERGRPARIPDSIARRVPGHLTSIAPLRVAGPPDRRPDLEISAEIRRSELDPLAHVNNAAYLDRVLDLGARLVGDDLADALDRPTVALEYVAAAGPGDRTVESAWSLGDDGSFAYLMSRLDRGPVLRATVRPTGT